MREPASSGAIDHALPAFLVVDRRHRIQRARGRVGSNSSAPHRAGWLSGPATLGDLMGCINAVVEAGSCGQTTRCGYCALEQVFRRARSAAAEPATGLARPRHPAPVLLERTCIVAGRPITRRLMVSARSMRGRRDTTGASTPARVLVGLWEAPPDA